MTRATKPFITNFTAEDTYALLRVGLQALGLELGPELTHPTEELTLPYGKMYLVVKVNMQGFHSLTITSMHRSTILELYFDGMDIILEAAERRKEGVWKVPIDLSALEAQLIVARMREPVNEYITQHFDIGESYLKQLPPLNTD